MSQPVRIQRRRVKGWKMPENTVYVGRPGKWGNPFIRCLAGTDFEIEIPLDPAMAVSAFKQFIDQKGGWFPVPLPWPKDKIPQWTTIEDVKRELRGKNLACWCRLDQPCHANVLLKLANAPVCEEV